MSLRLPLKPCCALPPFLASSLPACAAAAPQGKISREDVADLCLALLSQPCATNTTFEIKSTVPFSQPWTLDPANPPPPRDWATFLSGAQLQRGVTGRTVNGVYTGREPEEEALAKAGGGGGGGGAGAAEGGGQGEQRASVTA